MANSITRHIPNTITCLNLFSGCIACLMAFEAEYGWAFFFILLSGVFDFFDGMLARLLNAHSPIGKDLDSLADNVSFGLVPALIIFSVFKEVHYPVFLERFRQIVPYFAFILAIFSALRLAKFNNDARQTSSFVGLNVPSNAIFWGALAAGGHGIIVSDSFNAIYLAILTSVFSYLLVSEIPMFSLKFKNFSWKDNKVSFTFLLACIPLLAFLWIGGFAAIIIWYILLSLVTQKNNKHNKP